MPLDPAVAALLAQMNDPNAPKLSEMTPEMARAGFAAMVALQGTPEEVAAVEDRTVPGPHGEIPVRVYRPSREAGLPVLMYFHGGGWVIMDVNTHDPLCRALANAAGCAVVSVDYRLAPEHKYPVASEECYAATQWVAEHGSELGLDTSRMALAGDSAGGHLTAVVAQMARDRGGPALRAQVLHCPVTDYSFETPSYRENGEGYMLTRESMVWFWDHYLPSPERGTEPYASPLRGNLSGLPPALIQTGEFDPLRDEGAAYAEKLREAGVEVIYHQYDGLIHDAFLFFGVVPGGRANIDEAAAFLREKLAR